MADLSSILGSAGIGGAIGKAIVSLELDTKKYAAEMNAAQASTVKSTNSMSTGLSKFGGLASSAFAAAGIAAVAFGAFSVKAAVEANEAHLKLTNTFKNNANLADSSVEAFERQADALRELTGVDDEAVISGQALLGSFSLTGDEVMKLTPLVVDLAAKYDIDLQAAFKAVGKATEGSAGVLSRYGIVLDETKLKADPFATTLEGLGTAAGFAADRAELEPWRVLGAQFEEVAESVGQLLIPILRSLVDVIEPMVDLLGVLTENLDVVAVALGGFVAFRYLPGLLLRIAAGFEAVGAARIAGGLASAAAGIDSVAVSLGAAAPAAAGFALAYGGITTAVAAWDPLQTVDDTEALRDSMEVTTAAFGESEVILGRVAVSSNLVGNAFDDTGASLDEMRQKAGLASEGILTLGGDTAETKGEVEKASQAIKNFAHMTNEELKDFQKTTNEAFDSVIFDLDNMAHKAQVTRNQFINAHEAMEDRARELSRAMKELRGERWVNDDYIKFLSEQGPEWLIGFTKLTKEQQREAQQAWEDSAKATDNAKGSLDKIIKALDDMAGSTTKHKVEIHYEYVGYDPSKPGMGQQR